MLSFNDAIPSVEALLRRANRPKSVKPTEKSVQQMQADLDKFGYKRVNPEVYNSICSYGALILDGTNYKGLLLKGECGIGKSFGVEILAAIFKIPVFTPTDFGSAYKELEGNKAELEKFVTTGGNFYREPHIMVIDELGTLDTARNYGEITDIMCDVLDMRYRAMIKHGVKTIVTTNLSDRDILERYGTRIEDRMREMFYIKRVTGKSLRE